MGRVWLFIAVFALVALPSAASADCRIETFGDLSLKTPPGRAYVDAEINGQPVDFIVDTGAQISTINYSEARRLGTKILVSGITGWGIGGSISEYTAMFALKLGNYSFPRTEMMASAQGLTDDGAAVGLLGRELLLQHDLELDLKGASLRLLNARGCALDQLAYWAAGKPYGHVALISGGTLNSPVIMIVYLNGRPVRAVLDSGMPRSTVSVAAAERAGIGPAELGPLGEIGGLGPHRIAAGVATFGAFSIGDETIRNARIVVADMFKYNKVEITGSHLAAASTDGYDTPQMLLGADFLNAHHVLIAPDMHVMVFTYRGGPVFDISRHASPPPTPPTGQPAQEQVGAPPSPSRP